MHEQSIMTEAAVARPSAYLVDSCKMDDRLRDLLIVLGLSNGLLRDFCEIFTERLTQ
jgi:hypothetical protein